MDRKTIENKISDIVREHCQYNKDNINPEYDLQEKYGIDSLILVEIFIEVESEFGITIDSNVLTSDNFSTIGSFVDYVEKSYKQARKC